MTGRINDGQLVTIEPFKSQVLAKDDIVLVRVKGRDFLHLIKDIQGDRYLIGNNRGGINGWVGLSAIFGKVIRGEN